MSTLERYLQKSADANGINLVQEHKFHPTRRWRFDFADVDNKIAVECEGGIWSGGRHTRGAGYAKDAEKYNQATVLGWRILRYCTQKQIREQFINDYKSCLKEK